MDVKIFLTIEIFPKKRDDFNINIDRFLLLISQNDMQKNF